jgi:bifunctional DNA-binding transcriptional regulator/antitoxin component of YhaV-PrlF toxin-antitoxin module
VPSKYQRSVIPIGEGGLCITLPKSWTDYNNIKAGDKVDMIVNGEIIIRIKAKTEDNVSEQQEPKEESDA